MMKVTEIDTHRFCIPFVCVCVFQVGAFLKSPKFPIWILGSETHLSVFFTKASSIHMSIGEVAHNSQTETYSV